MRAVRVPYLRATPATLGPWMVRKGDGAALLLEEYPGWDATTDLKVERRVSIDGSKVRAQCQLGADAQVRLVAGWRSEAARAKDYPTRQDLSLVGNFDGDVTFELPGSQLAASVTMVVGLVLAHPGKAPSSLSARTPGSWLWLDEREVRLETSRGRFPMEWVDFSASGLPPDAPWFLDWPNQEWDAPLLGSLRLKLNKTNPTMSQLLELPDEDPRRKLVVRSAILDVAKQLTVTALASDEFTCSEGSFSDGSVGACVRALLEMAFPSTSLKALSSLMLDQAGTFHVRLQAGVVPFRGDIE